MDGFAVVPKGLLREPLRVERGGRRIPLLPVVADCIRQAAVPH